MTIMMYERRAEYIIKHSSERTNTSVHLVRTKKLMYILKAISERLWY